ncbi:MAG: hypothetical protein U9P14_07045 [Gemmatimonadota bacterium]|nr:hypothetical protein [Gemmatimonadota bacterium]
METILPVLPPETYVNDYDPSLIITGTLINSHFPFRGLIDPLEIITVMERYSEPGVENVLLRFSDQYYGRADDSPKAVAKFIDVFEDCIGEPTSGLLDCLEKLRKISGRWGGEKYHDKVFEAFYLIHEAFNQLHAVAPRYCRHLLFVRVSLRYLTRPLVIKPELLTPDEENYFLPHIFNVCQSEARTDYIDIHGGRFSGTQTWSDQGFRGALNKLKKAADDLESLEGAPEGEWLRKVALGLRMYAGYLRSIDNFYHAQLIRDRNAEVLAGEPRIPEKVGSWDGHPDILPWNEIMRDEFDNTNELISMLENGGMELVAYAKDPRYEDTFLLGPDLIGQLKKKARIMRAHWLDVAKYLAMPHK